MNPPCDARIVVIARTLIVQNGLRLVIMLKQLRFGRELVESIQNFASNLNKATRASGNDFGTPRGALGYQWDIPGDHRGLKAPPGGQESLHWTHRTHSLHPIGISRILVTPLGVPSGFPKDHKRAAQGKGAVKDSHVLCKIKTGPRIAM